MKLLSSKVNYLLFLSLLLITTLSCSDSSNSESNPLEKATILNESYGNSSEQKYDIYLPEGRTAASTKVFAAL